MKRFLSCLALFLCITAGFAQSPANDSFASRSALPGGSISVTGTLAEATAEAGEPARGPFEASASVWYEWTGLADGDVEIQFDPVTFPAVLGIFRGTNVADLVVLTHALAPAPLRFRAVAGTTYALVVDTADGAKGSFSFQLAFTAAAPNDDFAKATQLRGVSGWAQGFNAGATVEPGEPRHLGSAGPFGRSLWWSWTATNDGWLRIGTSHLLPNTALAVYTGNSLSNLTLLASNRFTAIVEARVVRGAAYWIAVDETNDTLVRFDFALGLAPANDYFADRITLAGNTGAVFATTVNASVEPGEPSPSGSRETLWWTWTAPSSSPLNFRFDADNHVLEAYTNSTLGSLRLLTPFDFVSQGSGRYTMANIRAGGTYQFRVRPNSTPLPLSFVWFQNAALVPNDHLVNRLRLQGSSPRVDGSLNAATREAGEPVHGGSGGVSSLWYGWRAPTNGTVRFILTNAGFNVVAAWYRGTNYGGLTALATITPFPTPAAVVPVQAGVDYSFAVDSSSFSGESFRILVEFAPTPANDNFTNRTVLVGNHVVTHGTTSGAGREPAEPNHAGSSSRTGTIWYTWQATNSGPVTLLASGPGLDPVLAVYTGMQINSLVSVASNNDYLSNGSRDSRVTFTATSGVLYQIAVATTPLTPGEVTLRLHRAIPPTIDWLQPASDLVVPGGVDVDFLVAASDSDGNIAQVQFTRGTEPAATVMAPPYAFSGTNLPFGTHSFRAYATDDDGYIAGSGARQVRVAPANDLFTNRFIIPSDTLSITGTLSGTARDANEPRQLSSAQRVAWWTWTAETNGVVYVSISNSTSRAVSIYTGSSLDALFLAGTSVNARYAVLAVEAGTDYHIAGEAAQDGDMVLSFATPPFASNDHFTNAIAISGTNAVVHANNTEATIEPGEPNHAGWTAGRSVWWTWTAPTNGVVSLRTEGSTFDTTLGIYAGSALGALAVVASNRTLSVNGNSSVAFATTPGATYHIALDGYFGFGEARLSLNFFPLPINDAFSQRIGLTGRTNVVSGNNTAASRQNTEPNPTAFNAGKTLWWSWTAPASGRALLRAESLSVQSIIGVFVGGAIGSLNPVTTSLNILSPTHSGEFNATAGVTYHFQMDSRSGFAGEITLSILLPETVANDAFSARFPLTGYVTNAPGANFNATRETNEPPHDAGQGGTAWWSWMAPETRTVSVIARGTPAPRVAVYEGTALPALTLVGSNYFNGNAIGAATFDAVAGTTYSLACFMGSGQMSSFTLSIVPNERPLITLTVPGTNAVYRLGDFIQLAANASDPDGTISNVHFSTSFFAQSDSLDPYTLTLTNVPPGEFTLLTRAMDNLGAFTLAPAVLLRVAPLNDNFADAAPLNLSVPAFAQNIGASIEPGELAHAGQSTGRSLWYSWTAPWTGRFGASTAGSSADTLLAVYTGDSLAGLTPLAANDNRSAFETWSEVQFEATAGTTYFIALDGYAGETGTFKLFLHSVPDNDLFSRSASLNGYATRRTRNVGSGEELGEPTQAGTTGSSLWWSWTAPATGNYLATTAGSDFDTVLEVLTGPSVSNLTLVARNDDGAPPRTSVVRFNAEAGAEYHFVVSGHGSAEGEVQFTIATNGVPTLFDVRQGMTDTFTFRALAEPGTTNIAQRSSTLTNWTSFQTRVATNWWTDFADPAAGGLNFYRVTRP